jgi:ATP-binding cassette subfamily F protein uup
LGNKVVELNNVGIELGGKTLFEHFNYIFEAGKKIGIVGQNGVGKTTLMKMVLGDLGPTQGKVEIGDNTIFNYVDQNRLSLNDEDSVVKAIGEGSETVRFGKQQIGIWTYLRRFLFTDDRINTLVGRLSGGEKSRLTLAKILCQGGNFLMLDEPTNDLDLPTLRMLEEALVSFEGCVLIVSHDRYFLNRVCDGIIALEGDNSIYYSEGNYDYYIEKRNQRLREEKAANAPKEKKEDTRVKPKVKKLSYNEARELEKIEEHILNAEAEVERIEQIFMAPDFYEKYATQTNELNQQLDDAKEKVKVLYARWEELESIKIGLEI